MDDNQVERAQADTDIPRVKKEDIERLFNTLEFVTVQPEGTTTTLCLAYLPGTDGKKFLLTTGVSACVVPALFNAEIGLGIARRNAENQAYQELWKLEGYALFQRLNQEAPKAYHGDRPAYQQRVIDELLELTERANKLEVFFGTATYHTLPGAEQDRLIRQRNIMLSLMAVLEERIEAFQEGGAA